MSSGLIFFIPGEMIVKDNMKYFLRANKEQ